MRGGKLASLVAGAALLLPGAASAAKQDIKLVSLTSWPPFSAKALPNNGFGNDIAKTVLERAGYNVSVKLMPWSRAKKMTQRGKFHVLANAWYNEDRAEKLAFTDRIAQNRIVFVSRKDSDFTYSGLDSLEGKTVGVVRDYDYRDDFLEADSFERQPANSFTTNLRKLKAGRVDVTLGDELLAKYLVNENFQEAKGSFTYSDEALSSKDLFVTVSRAIDGTKAIVSDFNEALAEIREDGTYDKIAERHGLK